MVLDEDLKIWANGDGSTVDVTYPYKYFSDSDLLCYIITYDDSATGTAELKTLNTDYTIAASVPQGAVVSFVTPATLFVDNGDGTYSGQQYFITRVLTYKNTTSIPALGVFFASTIQNMGDRIVLLIQQLRDAITRSVTLPLTTTVTGISFSDPVDTKALKFKDNGDGTWDIASSTYDPDEMVSDAATYAAASLSAKVLSEAAQSASETAQGLSEAARDKAQEWAEKAEDSEVETGKYSALHWAAKAQDSAENINLPDISTATAGQGLKVNSGKTGYEFADFTEDSETDLSGKSWFLDEDNMASNDPVKVASQQSVKAYIAAQLAAIKYVSTGDLAAYTFNSFTADGNWNDLNLSAVVGARAVLVHIRVIINAVEVNKPALFRTNGFSNTYNMGAVRTLITNTNSEADMFIQTDSSGVIEYNVVAATWNQISLVVAGYTVL